MGLVEDWIQRARDVPIESEILRRGIHLKKQGAERVGPCPRCGGTDRFAVNTVKGVFNCRQCGAAGDVIELVTWLDSCKFEEACETLTHEPKPNGQAGPAQAGPSASTKQQQRRTSGHPLHGVPITETHDYPDENGKLLFQVVRFDPPGQKKAFLQRRPDGKGGWIWNLRNTRVVLFQLPQLLADLKAKKIVVIVEGERDVLACRAQGICATCNPMGAEKWRDDFNETFRGHDVIICGDHDDPGRRHVNKVASALVGIAKRIRVLELVKFWADIEEGQDIRDWFNGGNVGADFWEIVKQLPDWTHVIDEDEWDAGDEPGFINPRSWLLGNQFCLGFVSSVVAAGGGGKTSLRILQFISMALGRSLCGQHVFRRSRVLLVSLEDDREEIQRRISAVIKHYKIDRKELKGWLIVWTPKKHPKFAEMKKGNRQEGELGKELREKIKRLKIDVVSLDPFIKTHSLKENDNTDMDFVCDMLSALSIECKIGVDSPHHVKKGTIEPGDADAGRGASGVRDAARLVYTLCTMDEKEAQKFDVTESARRFFVRLDSAKTNTAPPSEKAEWFRLVSVSLGNATAEYPAGDHIQVAEPWTPPDSELPVDVANKILDRIHLGMPSGQRYSSAPRATDRQAWRAVFHFTKKAEWLCRKIIKEWIDDGVLTVGSYHDPITRKAASCLFVDSSKRPT
jgi:hypothetical protein